MAGLAPSASGTDRPNHRYSVSPDGTVRIDFDANEMRMSLWVENPTVRDLASGKVLFSLGWDYDAAESWIGAHNFTLYVRHYPDGNGVLATFDLDAGTVRIDGEEGAVPLAGAEAAIEAALGRRYTAARAAAPVAAPSRGAKGGLLRLALFLLTALVLIAGIGAAAYWYTGGR
ncbi:MAG: hypothetical protein KDE15_04570 [Erythrobacter sp.]|nr:hypothetical protein [Erythrobacter sp.]